MTKDEEGRENLYRARADQLNNLAKSLDALELLGETASPAKRAMHEKEITRLCAVESPHSLCCRSFAELWIKDKIKAMEIWEGVVRYLQVGTAS